LTKKSSITVQTQHSSSAVGVVEVIQERLSLSSRIVKSQSTSDDILHEVTSTAGRKELNNNDPTLKRE
jgi:predicted RNA-binding protein